jgi:hypothetical protein
MALVAAILVMLLLGVFALSVSVLADLESRLGLNQRAAQQALVLAEAGLEHGRNMLRDAVTPGDFNALIANAATRQLGVPTTGIPLGSGRYWVRVDNDCAAPGGFAGSPAFVPVAVQDDPGGGCSDTVDANQTAVLTAWSEVTDGSGRVIGRARLRAHYTIMTPWKHACYDQDELMCIEDAVGGCNNNPCIDPSDPRHPNGPTRGDLPIPSDIRCGTYGRGLYPRIPDNDIPDDVKARMTMTAPCVIYPYYGWAIKTAAPTRATCQAIVATGYGTDECDSELKMGTYPWDPTDSRCHGPGSTPSKCHGLVFFGPGQNVEYLGNGAHIEVRTSGGHIGCVGQQKELPAANCYKDLPESDSKVIYVMGQIIIRGGAVQGTVVIHGDGGSTNDFGLQGQSQVTTHPCPAGSPSPSPGCGYPLAILAYDPNEPAPTVAGQSIRLDLSSNLSDTQVRGLIYTGGTADVSSLTVNGGLIGYDVNIKNTSTRITYDPTYGNAARLYGNSARPPGFKRPSGFEPTDGSSGVLMYPATWVHCTYYASETTGPTPCS